MSERFYFPEPFDAPTLRLEGPEAHHLRDVLRLRSGQVVALFDGRGTEARAEIIAVAKSAVELKLLTTQREEQAAAPRIVLGTAVPKGERFRWLVEKTTELGIDVLVPLNCARGVVEPRENRLDKMRSLVVAACKQSGRNRLMEIEPMVSWSEFVDRARGARRMIVADPSGASFDFSETIGAPAPPDQTIVLAVGPEGGFTRDELELAVSTGASVVSLGKRILRIETAAIALAALFASLRAASDPRERGEV